MDRVDDITQALSEVTDGAVDLVLLQYERFCWRAFGRSVKTGELTGTYEQSGPDRESAAAKYLFDACCSLNGAYNKIYGEEYEYPTKHARYVATNNAVISVPGILEYAGELKARMAAHALGTPGVPLTPEPGGGRLAAR